MRQKILTWTVLVTFMTFNTPSFVRADNPGPASETLSETSEPANTFSQPEATSADIDIEEDATPQGNPVSPSDNSAAKKKSREFWTNIIIAGVAVVVAVVSILVVSNNNGRRK